MICSEEEHKDGRQTDEYRQGHFTTPTALPADTNAGRAVGVCIG